MAIRVNPKMVDEVAKFGAEDVQKCYHCGSCSAVCVHSDDLFMFPRRPMRLLQMGFESKLRSSLDPWLCYYCGQCSTQCPRGAEPGETMMSLRRWLTSRYDFTGISRLFYRSWRAELAAIILVAVATAVGFTAYGFRHGDIAVYDGPNAFLSSAAVHRFDWTMAAVLVLLLAINAVRMGWLTMGPGARVHAPLATYLRKLPLLPLHFFTQKRYADCERRRPWAIHFVLMLSYLTLLVLIMGFLHAMQAGPAINWAVHGLGYLASIGLIGTVIWSIRGRRRRVEAQLEHSHESDWIFLVLILFVACTGVLQHVLHRTGADQAANIAYVVHLMGVVPMLVLEVPFSKWSHLAYRPLAMYFAEVQREAIAKQQPSAARPAAALHRAA